MRPNRIYIDEDEKLYYIINKKKVYIKEGNKGIIQKLNVKNVVNVPHPKKIKRRRKRVVPKYSKGIVPGMRMVASETIGGLPYHFFEKAKKIPLLEDYKSKKDELDLLSYINKTSLLLKDSKPVPQKQNLPLPSIEEGTIRRRLLKTPAPVRRRRAESTPARLMLAESPTRYRKATISSKKKSKQVTELEDMGTATSNNQIHTLESLNHSLLKKLAHQMNEKFATHLYKAGNQHLLKEAIRESTEFNNMNPEEFSILINSLKGGGEEDGLYNDEISKIVKKRLKHYVPVIASDEITDLLNYIKKGDKSFAFIINTNPIKSDGSGNDGYRPGHWRSVFINNADDFPSMEYFDPLAEGQPEKSLLDIMKKIGLKMNPEKHFLYKQNLIRRQNKMTSNCGWHSIKFIDDRIHHVPFSKASGYDDFIERNKGADDSSDGEKEIEKYFKKYKSYI